PGGACWRRGTCYPTVETVGYFRGVPSGLWICGPGSMGDPRLSARKQALSDKCPLGLRARAMTRPIGMRQPDRAEENSPPIYRWPSRRRATSPARDGRNDYGAGGILSPLAGLVGVGEPVTHR